MGAAGVCQAPTLSRVDSSEFHHEAEVPGVRAPCCLNGRLSIDRGERLVIREGNVQNGTDEVHINDLMPYLPEANSNGLPGFNGGDNMGRLSSQVHGMYVIYESQEEEEETPRPAPASERAARAAQPM
mmetsp:Transcript_2251/g.3884  ORF Transcript_2251/g.3884 Transcript_2251/m.3884 type:complete len:128 (-) Transcript_2251:96-479(-)